MELTSSDSASGGSQIRCIGTFWRVFYMPSLPEFSLSLSAGTSIMIGADRSRPRHALPPERLRLGGGPGDPGECVRGLVGSALGAGGRDNITALVVFAG